MIEVQNEAGAVSAGRREQVRRIVEEWRTSLIDISGANRLLYFKASTTTLNLASCADGVVDRLLEGKPLQSSKAFADGLDLALAASTLKKISAKSREVAEELGISVSYLALGFATWSPPGSSPDGDAAPATYRVPSAPVLLYPLTLTPRTGAGTDFTVEVASEPRLNPVLMHYFAATFGTQFDETSFLERCGGMERHELLASLEIELRASVPSLAIADGVFLANFTYADQATVEDLDESNVDFLAESDMVAALAGDREASDAVRSAGHDVEPNAPDLMAPSDEHLILDADASQSYVINAAAAGQNLVVQGPPGTGKSQTIANLIAELVARDKTVLFVAQKRAAITAVLDRLAGVGLTELTLDLFETGRSRKAVVNAIGRSLEARKTAVRPPVERLHSELSKARDRLVDHGRSMTEVRKPWGLSLIGERDERTGESTPGLFDLAIGARALGETELRLPVSSLRPWETTTHDRIRDDVRAFVDLDGLSPADPAGAWSRDALSTEEALRTSTELVSSILNDSLAPLRSAVEYMCASYAIDPVHYFSTASAFYLAQLADRMRAQQLVAPETLVREAVPDDELQRLLVATGDSKFRSSYPVKLSWGERRKHRAAARVRVRPSVGDRHLHDVFAESMALRYELYEIGVRYEPPVASQLPDISPELYVLQQKLAALAPYVGGYDASELSWDDLEEYLQRLQGDRRRFQYPRHAELRSSITNACGNRLLDELMRRMPISSDAAADVFTYAFAMSLVSEIESSDRRISGFTSADLRRANADFVQYDVNHRQMNAGRIRRVAAERLSRALDSDSDQEAVIRQQVKRKRGYKSVRTLLTEATEVMLAAKPVWAMSPQNASEYLPAQQLFDVVIFDEASQVLPSSAIPAIARGRQLVVAGDSLQLPPTTVFTKTIAGVIADEDDASEVDSGDDDYTPGVVVRDMRSILDAIELKLGTQRSRHLSWHYRSKDERLIATSNEYVYRPEGRFMTTFPAALSGSPLTHEIVPPSSGLGKNNKSPVNEVNRVVDLIQQHASDRPDQSLGVIAFGSDHAIRIEDEVQRRSLDDADLNEFITAEDSEPFFVKPIERVQGDERDHIILTVGYARNDDGRLSHQWGPVQQENGHRRVNVAISRSKSAMTLVTSFSGEDVNPTASTAEGFQLMRKFIAYMGSGGQSFGDEGSKDVPLNPFEYDILQRLLGAGLDVVPQWGSGGYRIDFAVRHPEKPGAFVLAVEADGAAYHSGATARDRDRLRQQVLEMRGWKFVRIWSTDWFYDPEPQLARVMEAYELALEEFDKPKLSKPAEELHAEIADRPAAVVPKRGPAPDITPGYPVAYYSDEELRKVVRWVKSDDLPHTRDEIFEMTKEALGFKRNGKKIVDRINEAIDKS